MNTLDWLKSINPINTCNCCNNKHYNEIVYNQRIQGLITMIEQKDKVIYNLSTALELLSNKDELLNEKT